MGNPQSHHQEALKMNLTELVLGEILIPIYAQINIHIVINFNLLKYIYLGALAISI